MDSGSFIPRDSTNTWMDCRILHYPGQFHDDQDQLKAARGVRSIQKSSCLENQVKMSIHEAAIFYQVKDPDKALMRRRHRHRQRHVGVRYTGKNSNNGKNGINGKSDKIGTDLRNGTNEHRPLESTFFCWHFFLPVSCFCWTFRVQTPANVVHATGCEDTTLHRCSTRKISRLKHSCFICSRFIPQLQWIKAR